MTTNAHAPIDCDEFTARSMEYMEGDVDPTTRAAMDAHLARCGECSALIADMRSIASAAGRLPELTPSRDLWAGIAARIEAPVISLADRAESRRRSAPAWWRTAAAAAVLVTLTSSVTYYATRQSMVDSTAIVPSNRVASNPPAVDTSAPSTTAQPSPESTLVATTSPAAAAAAGSAVLTPASARSNRAPSAAATLDGATATYDAEIRRLRALIAQRRSQMDTATVNVIEKNLTIIDEAIAQCRAALARDPNSRFLLENLNSALDNKVQLLRTAAMLPART